jgi:hypothetical protein
MLRGLIVILVIIISGFANAQSISGFVYDEENNPVPYARVAIKDNDYLTSTDGEGKYFLQVDQGDYEVVFSAVGYEDKVMRVVVDADRNYALNVWISIGKNLQETIVKAKRKDPAYDIMQKASERRQENQRVIDKSRCTVYIKAVENVIYQQEAETSDMSGSTSEDGVAIKSEGRKETKTETPEEKLAKSRNMAEIVLLREFQAPNQIKETRQAIRQLGNVQGLYYLTTVADEFNFYDNLVKVPRLTEAPLVSPLNTVGVLHYKFELLSTEMENGRFIYRIGIKQRTRGNSLVEGTIWIIDTTFAIRRLELTLQKSNLKGYDNFTVVQEYDYLADNHPVLVRQEFRYGLKTKKKSYEATTVARYENFDFNPEFPKNYFSNELGVVVEDAYKKDTGFWASIRPEPLSREEQRYQEVQDSIRIAHEREEYLDSIDRDYNKITWERMLYFGMAHRNRKKKEEWGFGSLLEYFQPVNLGGIRINPYFTYFKKWENERYIQLQPYMSFGVTNLDLVGVGTVVYHYGPFKNAQVEIRGGIDYEAFNPYTSFVTAFQRSNYYKRNFGYIRQQGEIFNGFIVRVELDYADRRPLENFNFGYTGQISTQWFGATEPQDFDPYQAFIAQLRFAYTPFQKYIREPHRKVILGSRWPTFFGQIKKGVAGVLGSDVNFDFITLGMEQAFNLMSLGSSRYNLTAGKFLNTNSLLLADYKFFRFSDPYFFSNPLKSFQMLDTNLVTTRWFIEAHYIHHFTGGISQKFPLLRKLALRSTAGGGAMWLEESNFFHAELFAGLERIFQIGRVRFRTGVYYAVPLTRTWKWYEGLKFSIEFYDNSKGKWRF